VEVLAAYSHSAQASDLRRCRTGAHQPCVAPTPSAKKRPGNLRERVDERDIAELITAYREGATAASLATAHGLSRTRVKRLLHIAGVRRKPSIRRATKATPAATHP